MGDKEKVVTTFYFQTFVWYPSKKEKAEFPRKFTLQEIKQQLWQGAKMSCQAKLASLPLSEKYMFKIGWGIAYKPFLLWLLVKGSTLQMPAKCALRAPCPWEWHKKAKKVPKSEAGTQRHRWWKSAFYSKNNKNLHKRKTTFTPRTILRWGGDFSIFRCVPECSDCLHFWHCWDQAIEILPAFTFILHKTDSY